MLLFVSLIWDYFAYYIFGFLFTLFTCRWSECCKSHRALDPYRNGPSLLWHGADIFSCVAGQGLRHGYLGTTWNLASPTPLLVSSSSSLDGCLSHPQILFYLILDGCLSHPQIFLCLILVFGLS